MAVDHCSAEWVGLHASRSAERFIRTLKENLLWVHPIPSIEELRLALQKPSRKGAARAGPSSNTAIKRPPVPEPTRPVSSPGQRTRRSVSQDCGPVQSYTNATTPKTPVVCPLKSHATAPAGHKQVARRKHTNTYVRCISVQSALHDEASTKPIVKWKYPDTSIQKKPINSLSRHWIARAIIIMHHHYSTADYARPK